MASVYDSILVKGQARYRRDKRFIAKDKVPTPVLEVLNQDNIVDENGLIIVDDKGADEAKLTDDEQKALDEEDTTNDNQEEETDETESSTEDDDPGTDPDHDTTVPKAPKKPETSVDDEDDEPTDKAAKKEVSKPRAKRSSEPRFVSKVPQSKPGMGFPRKNGKTVDIFDGETPHTHIKLVGGHTVPLSNESFQNRTEKEIEQRLVELGYDLIDYNRNEALDGQVDTEDDDGGGLTDDRP